MLQIILTILIFLVLVIPLGRYIYKIADNQKTFADPLFNPIDNIIYKICGIDKSPMGWKKYAFTLITTNIIVMVIGFTILMVQGLLFINPNNINGMEWTLAFNTAASFITNTNLQHYSGESGLSYFSQMIVITMMMFFSAATGYSAAMAMVRGLCGKPLGNFFQDSIRVTTRALIPIAFIASLILVSQGTPQTLTENITVSTIEGKFQDIPLGPVASLESIKHLGTNGGGFFGANSSTPFENPTIISNLLEMYLMMLMPGACVIAFGLMCFYRNREKSDIPNKFALIGGTGRAVFTAMFIIFLVGLSICYYSESSGNPILTNLGIEKAPGSMEGKEMRIGVEQSSVFTTVTTSFTTGTVNNMHDTLTPLGGMVAMVNMMLNTVFGGIGVGLMNMLLYVMLAVFLCALMIGKTPEYLGKKIESREMKLIVICITFHPLILLGFSSIASYFDAGNSAVTNPGFHGLSQILYEYASAAANNGSGFEGLADNTTFWNITTGLVMLLARYVSIVLQLAIAASFLEKKYVSESSSGLNAAGVSFGFIVAAVVILFGALTFLPALVLGPIAEHLLMIQ